MRFSLARWGRVHLALAIAAYWLGLALATLGSAALALRHLLQLPPGHGDVEAGFQNTLFHLTMLHDGAVAWTGSAYLVTILAWVLVPPAGLIWAWKHREEATPALGSAADPRALAAAPMQPGLSARTQEAGLEQKGREPGRR